jgi:poly-gamma-glutamate synthesis protein (capsule biosynthesis protein)
MAECGADFITAQHTHCIGCFEEFRGSYLLYGQGNFLFARMKNKITKQGLITEILFSDSAVQVKQHVVTVSDNDVVRYDENQDLSGFYERSKELNDFSLIEEKYKQFAYNRPSIKDRFLAAYRGNSFYCRVLKRIMPRYYKKNVLENYKRKQLMRISKTMSSDRYGEDMLAAVNFMLEKTKAQL